MSFKCDLAEVVDRDLTPDVEVGPEGRGLERAHRQLQLLYRLTQAVTSAESLEATFEAALDGIAATLRTDRASILLFDNKGTMRFRAARGLSEEYKRAVDGHSPWRRDDSDPEPIFIDDAARSLAMAPYRDVFAREGIAALAFVPLVRSGRLLGKFMLYHRTPHAFSDNEKQLAVAIAGNLAVAVERQEGERTCGWLQAIIESSNDAILTKSLDGEVTSWNAAAQRLFGYTSDEIIGRPMTVLVPPERLAEEAASIAGTRRGERIDHFETVRLRKDGTLVPVSVTLSPIIGAGGAVLGVSEIVRDISERRAFESEFRTLVDTVPLLAWYANPDGHVAWYNQSWYEFTGTTFDETEGWGWRSVHDPDDLPRVMERWRAALESGEPWEDQFRLRRRDGEWRWFLGRARPLRDSSGQIVRWFGTNVDIHERSQTEQALTTDLQAMTLLRELGLVSMRGGNLDSILGRVVDAAVAIAGADFGNVQLLDTKTGELHVVAQRGFPASWLDFWNRVPAGLGCCGAALERAERVIVRDVEESPLFVDTPALEVQRRAGVRAVQSTPLFSRAGQFLGMLSTHYRRPHEPDERVLRLMDLLARQAADIIDRAQAEEERERLLASEQAARSVAESQGRAKDEFLAMLGHELRNPLAPILTALHLIKLKADNRFAKERHIIERQVEHMVRLVDDLLDVSKIARGKIELKREPSDLAEVAAKAIEMACPLLEERQHHFEVSIGDGIRVEGDIVRLAQVVANLLTNAAKYTEPGGSISLRAFRDGGEVIIAIKDTGRGIVPELLPRIFDLFVQGERTVERSEGGLGLGLALVRSLVELHGGTVAAHSDGRGRGSEFVVRLPALPAVAAAPSAPEPSLSMAPSAVGRRVLVVDDNRDAADLLAEILRAVGHEAAVAYDGPEALRAAEELEPDVAILDIGLPVMDGYELAVRLRERFPDVHMVALTGYGQQHDRARSKDAGFREHFVKPVGAQRILEHITALC